MFTARGFLFQHFRHFYCKLILECQLDACSRAGGHKNQGGFEMQAETILLSQFGFHSLLERD